MKKMFYSLTSVLCTSLLLTSNVMAEVNFTEGYLRAVPPGQMMSAAFMQLSNSSDKSMTIVGGTSPLVKAIEVHTHTKVDGVMKMRRIEGITIAPGKSTVLKPGGLHIMFIGLKQTLTAGENFSFNLTFKDGSTQALSLPIKSLINP